ncbi:hypothetical protein LDI20_001536 [Campylobacter lari]|nr:hypothetical protein [Campylobacter lari]EIE4560717.1 hypothetical protein [Campylobacter lari]EIE4566932.1 hypothetical protein [Campylobacter lari]EIE4610396.1 hypothetical protein [Campylobacter lari]
MYLEAILFDKSELINIKKNSTCTTMEIRLPIFAPINKATGKSKIFIEFQKNRRTRQVTTQWGEVFIKGSLLTQVHKDILDLIVSSAKKIIETKDERLLIEFSISEVLKKYKDTGKNHKWFKNILEDIITTVVKIKDHNNVEYYFHIIGSMKYDEGNNFVGIILSKEYLQFYRKTLSINYNKEVENIVHIENSFIKSIIRFFISHNKINIEFDNLLTALGIDCNKTERNYRKLRKELETHIDCLNQFNIKYDKFKETLKYNGNDNVKFIFS